MACRQAVGFANAAWRIIEKYKKCYKKGVDRLMAECYYIQVAEIRQTSRTLKTEQ